MSMRTSFFTLRYVVSSVMVPVAMATTFAACASEEPTPSPELGESESALTATDPVSKAVAESCTTTSVKGLSVQLIAEIQCLQPGSFTELQIPNTTLGSAVFPYLQTPAAAALAKVAAARNVKLSINSATRSLPQQFLLYSWYKQGRCGIGLAATPGNSNHESGLAVDVDDNAAWRTAFESNGFKWLGSSDPVHYDYKGPGTVDMDGLSVYAFQRLWNRNHPEDKIAEDKSYGTDTAARLAKSPVGGFPIGANCSGPADAGADTSFIVPTPVDAGVPPSEDAGVSKNAETPSEDTGCSMHANAPTAPSSASLGGFALVLLAFVRRTFRARA